ncbi:SAM-dependent methyltransferase [Yersinia pseudotuberculosis]|uniref:Type 11 methyltransferase n=1 Tax=Yersinia pseudotuberculosis TaxID=633 RepID=A0A380SBV2_YERPU|nr:MULTISPECIES: class I SAM-dependent methyltransferase [Yersinia pseudotuberculosis complex]PSH19720.1 SAM-dependent methyltransferase [Yersinia pseudotuberculosis]SUQ39490.1 type 11 methyltransferase [Yersinia pseudotuberculosis]
MTYVVDKKITPDAIQTMNYPDFVALMKQDNTPPGGSYTLDYWIEHSNISKNSLLLDLACSTGYSSRYCYEKLNTLAQGIDISNVAINLAKEKASILGANDSLTYQVSDACELPFKSVYFTHILAGCNFAFIQERETALDEVIRVLKKGGVICTSNFYYRRTPESQIINNVYNAIGFKPDPKWDLQYWHDFFNHEKLELLHEKNYELTSQNYSDLQKNISNYIRKDNEFTRELDKKIQDAFYERFLSIREPLNTQRDYQGVTIQLWRKK